MSNDQGMMKNRWTQRVMSIVASMGILLNATVVSAQQLPTTRGSGNVPLIVAGLDENGQVQLLQGQSRLIRMGRPYKRVSLGQPDVAEINFPNNTSVLVTAKKPGATQLMVWDTTDQWQAVDLVIRMDTREMEQQYRRIFPGSRVEVTSTNGMVVLRGRMDNLHAAAQAEQIASPYGKVINLLEVSGGQQVMLQVRFAEVSRSATSALGVNLGFTDGTGFGASNIGQVNPFSVTDGQLTSGAVNPSVTVFGRAEVGSTAIEAFVTALRQNNLLRVLAEPNLIAISGEQASFLAGGEYPIPVPQSGTGDNTVITIEFKEFGVKLNFVPVVMGDGRIRLKVAPEVSDLDFSTAVRFNGFVVPGLTQRKLTTTIELADGQTFALAGLLSSSMIANKDVTPLLGDIPIVGALFRSVRYQRKETELVVLVTPRLVDGMNPAQVPSLPGEKWRHPTEADLFFNQDLGGPATESGAGATTRPAKREQRPYGQQGFAPATQPVAQSAR